MDSPLWTSRIVGEHKLLLYRPLPGLFSINKKRGAGRFTPGYNPAYHKPLELDRPFHRRSRMKRIMGEGLENYEFYGFKTAAPDITKSGMYSTWYPGKIAGEFPHVVPIFAKHRLTGKIQHISWISASGRPGATLETLLPAIANIPEKTPFPISLSQVSEGKWFFGQRKINATISVFAPGATGVPPSQVFHPAPKIPALNTWLAKNWKVLGGATLGASLLAFALSRPRKREDQKKIEGIRRPHSSYSIAEGMSGGMKKAQHHELTDFGSGRDAVRQLTGFLRRFLTTQNWEGVVQSIGQAWDKAAPSIGKVEFLGAGGYGSVLGTSKAGIGVAIKRPWPGAGNAMDWLDVPPSKEAAILKRLSGVKGVPELFSYEPTSKSIIMEKVEGKAIKALGEVPQAQRRQAVRDVYATYLSAIRRGYLPDDIHAGNIMVTKSGRANIVDVGLWKEIKDQVPGINVGWSAEVAKAFNTSEAEIRSYVGIYNRSKKNPLRAKVLASSRRVENALRSGIQSDALRLSNMPNMTKAPGTVPIHPNHSRSEG